MTTREIALSADLSFVYVLNGPLLTQQPQTLS